ncbi:hypothetical protein FRC19_003526 [Serendipita sp. 401]|nr:hypothetical protein FRC19_003526 [Serendipita sp. 401]
MNMSDDELDAEPRRPRASLDAQRYTYVPKKTPTISPTASATTYLLPILLAGRSVGDAGAQTQPISLQGFSGNNETRRSSSIASLPQEIANADLAIATDRSFVETSSGLAARSLKIFYERMGAETAQRNGSRLRAPYVITSLDVNGEPKYRVSLRLDDGGLSDITNPQRPNSIIPSLGGLINSVISGTGRNSHPGGPRQILRRPRSISEPRDSSHYTGSATFVNPFSPNSRHSFEHQRSSLDETPEASSIHSHHDYESPFGPGVIYNDPCRTLLSQGPSFSSHGLREAQSFESSVTAKADDTSNRHQASVHYPHKESRLNTASISTTPYSTLVFDVLQTYHGAPLPDRLSELSNEPTVKLSSSITAVPRDDPRFVIWGEILPDRGDDAPLSRDSQTDVTSTSQQAASPRRTRSRARSGDTPSALSVAHQDRLIVAATIERWIAQLTSENESFELVYFFLTYRIYISGVDLCHLLICRFHWALEEPSSKQDETVRAMVRARTYKMIRHWLLMWFKIDFASNPDLCQALTNWVNTLRKDPALEHARLRDALDMVKRTKKLIRECKAENERERAAQEEASNLSSRHALASSTPDPNLINNSIFDDAETGKQRHSISDPSSGSSALLPALEAALAAGPRMDLTTNAVLPHGIGAQPLVPAQGVLQQPLHLAILATKKSAQISPHGLASAPSALPAQHRALSRALFSTMGKLGRWRRVLNARSTPVHPQLDCSGVASFEIEHLPAPGGLYGSNYQRSENELSGHTVRVNDRAKEATDNRMSERNLITLEESAELESDNRTPQPSLVVSDSPRLSGNQGRDHELKYPVETGRTSRPPSGLSLSQEAPRSDVNAESVPISASVAQGRNTQNTDERDSEYASYKHVSSAPRASFSSSHEDDEHDERNSAASSDVGRNSLFNSSEEDYGQPISGSVGWFTGRSLRSNDFVEMDEYVSSEEEPMDNLTRKNAKKLPHQRDLKSLSRIDSASPDISVRSTVAERNEEQSTPGKHQRQDSDKQRVFAWQLAYIDSDIDSGEDEPRDAEAALRRLEGHIDRDRQRKKETKVEGWLRQVAARKAGTNVTIDFDTNKEEQLLAVDASEDRNIFMFGLEDMSTAVQSLEVSGIQPDLPVAGAAGAAHLDQALSPIARGQDLPLQQSEHGNSFSDVDKELHSLEIPSKQSFIKISGSKGQTIPLSIPIAHESFVLIHRSFKIAQQLTRIESDLWRSVPFEDLFTSSPAFDPETQFKVLDWADFIQHRARSRHTPGKTSIDLLTLRTRFELTAMFTASEIFLTRPALRPILLAKFIRIALKCYTLNNFSSLVAIMSGLDLPPVQHILRNLPQKSIGTYEMDIYEALRSFASSEGNYRSIRDAIAALVVANKANPNGDPSISQSANPTKTSADLSRACIPFIGIYLSQLTKYDKLPDYVDPTAPTEPVEDEPGGALTQPRHPEVFSNLAPLPPSMTVEPLINVHKQRMISKVAIDFLNSQQLTGKYRIELEKKLHSRCLRLKTLDMVRSCTQSVPRQSD